MCHRVGCAWAHAQHGDGDYIYFTDFGVNEGTYMCQIFRTALITFHSSVHIINSCSCMWTRVDFLSINLYLTLPFKKKRMIWEIEVEADIHYT